MYIQLQNFGRNSSVKSMYYDGTYECIERIHQFPEIVCVMEGEVEITVDGNTEKAKAGDLAVITPFRIHSFKTPRYCKIWIGVISTDFAEEFISGDAIYSTGDNAVFTPTKSLFDYLCEHLPPKYDLPAVLDGDVIAYRQVKALVYSVFEEYTRTVPQKRKNVKGVPLSETLLYMSNHYTKNISLTSVAKALGYTPTYISHCISVIPGMNFRKLLNSLRVDAAKIHILKGSLKMIDVALECGFSGERSFNRAFLDVTGMTPSEYRRTKSTS
ncbi:MAG: AraC family transcriptional regulator [Ruminococcaceae bacterium]|nr:AraC family transcriptional regulator [Oscillospiraceae bacterium]